MNDLELKNDVVVEFMKYGITLLETDIVRKIEIPYPPHLPVILHPGLDENPLQNNKHCYLTKYAIYSDTYFYDLIRIKN